MKGAALWVALLLLINNRGAGALASNAALSGAAGADPAPAPALVAGGDAAGGDDEAPVYGPPAPSKKDRLLGDKLQRKAIARRARRARPAPLALEVLTLRNLWTSEVLPLWDGAAPPPRTWDRFLRCHHTNQSTAMDVRLLSLVRAAAAHFQSRFVEIVSGFRAPKYNLALRKKGRQVARDSQHTHGNAVDFRVAGVQVAQLRQFVRQRRLGGVGYYPKSQFVHADTGPIRTWTAE